VLSLTSQIMEPQSPLAPVLLVAGVVMLGVLLTFGIRAKIARRNRDRPSPRELIEQVKATHEQADDAHAVSSHLADTARRLSAQLDNKARRLEVLIRQADERITALSGGTNEALSTRQGGARDETPSPAAPLLDPLTRSVYEHADTGLSALEIAQQLDEQVGKVELILALREPTPQP
jgi:type VI protein secretion system component VasK